MTTTQGIFVLLVDLECRECRRGATQLAKLANITQDNPLIGRVDCMKNVNLCGAFEGHDTKTRLPYMIFIS